MRRSSRDGSGDGVVAFASGAVVCFYLAVTLKARLDGLERDLTALCEQTDGRLKGVDDDLRRASADLTHVRTQVAVDVDRLAEAQAQAAMLRRIDATLDAVSDNRER